jgi:hypothetical protein
MRYNTFLKDLFEKVIVLGFTAYGFKICILCHHWANRFLGF